MHPHWKSVTSIEQIVQDLAANASAADPAAMRSDVQQAIARAIELTCTPRPMISAPKDGTQILLYVPADDPMFVVGFWADWGGWDYAEKLVQDVATGTMEPAGWLPLPPTTVLQA